MDPVILHHGVAETVAIGLVALTAAVSFTAGVAFSRLQRKRSGQRAEGIVDPADRSNS